MRHNDSGGYEGERIPKRGRGRVEARPVKGKIQVLLKKEARIAIF